jgi:hypothetical protein
VTFESELSMPQWNPQSLRAHFNKRVTRDAACMQDVIGRPVNSITENDYKQESFKVLSEAWICYSGEVMDNRNSGRAGIVYYDAANHFVDDRLLTTIVSRSTDAVLTCYHEDFNRSHRSSQYKLEQMVKYLEHLGNQRRGNMLCNFSTEQFTPSIDALRTLESELARVNAIPENKICKP